jgi:sugar/nucleoside kinase (ribokinase family)
MNENRPDVVVLGDINLDWVVPDLLPFRFADLQENGLITWTGLDEVPGGSGLNFAFFARREGLRTLLVGKVGDDLAGRAVRAWLEEQGITSAVAVDSSAGTGRAFIARDAHDIRLLVNNKANANHRLDPATVRELEGSLRHCALLYISGYCVMDREAPRYQATRRAIEVARAKIDRKTPFVVFDVVPHRIYEIFNFGEFRELTQGVDILISEVATMRRFLGLGSKAEVVDRAIAETTAQRLKAHFNRFILRYGPSGCDEELRWDGERDCLTWQETGHCDAEDKRGFGDRLAIAALRDFFHVLPAKT